MMTTYPVNVGVTALEVYFPYLCVDQSQLETYDGASAGKYTIGLGQTKMGFCGDREDINSICLTVLHNLIDRHNLDLNDIGRLEVGTETIIDKSKSVKTCLMQLFEASGNTDIEGIDTTNACFGGTAALFNAINWIESSAWDGRKALVIVGDIALYASGSARPTGGCGAIAMMIGPDAPLVFDRGMRAHHMAHVYDFYKPNMSSEYPVIDGHLSIKCFLSALDICYERYKKKASKCIGGNVTLKNLDYMIFHTPFCKMTKKAMGRMFLGDYLSATDENHSEDPLSKFKGITLESTFSDPALLRDVEKVSVQYSGGLYKEKTEASTFLPTNIGNMYTASLYSSLVGLLVSIPPQELVGKRVGMFSYGSGLASSMFSLTMRAPGEEKGDVQSLNHLTSSLASVKERLMGRKEVEPAQFVETIETRERIAKDKEFVPTCSSDDLWPGTYYLTGIDGKLRRSYERKQTSDAL